MKRRTVVKICDVEYSLLGDENIEYTQKVAEYVDKKMQRIRENSSMSALEAAVLTGVNLADETFRAVDAAENLRMQLKEYFDEISRLKDEVSQLKRDLQKPDPGKK